MNQRRALIVGSTGMLGGAVKTVFYEKEIDFAESSRTQGIVFDAERDSVAELFERASLSEGDYVVNCVGLTKAHIDDRNSKLVERAVRLNVLFPLELSRIAELRNIRVIQVATDCVFSGRDGGYLETSPHDAHDMYGKSKSMGEIPSPNMMHLRCSLIGPETNGKMSLFFEWVRNLQHGSVVNGFKNHIWNGLTANTFGKIVAGIVEADYFSSGVQHLVPSHTLSKFDLVKLELNLLGRSDVHVKATMAENYVDRTLLTEKPASNAALFSMAGYRQVPEIREMMEELPWEAIKGS